MHRVSEALWRFNTTACLNAALRPQYRALHASSYLRYDYKPLRANEIRLLDLYPGHIADPVRCMLRNVALTESPLYESLSYCWGSRQEEVMIHCDDDQTYIKSNLFSALRHLRHEKIIKTLWIDALCIDQANLEERAQQVLMMKDIFQLSERCVVWLGGGGQNSPYAFDLVRQLVRASQGRDSQTWRSWKGSNIPPLYDPAWVAFVALLQRPWWHRAWIVQEVSVTKHLLLVCGYDCIAWDKLLQAIQHAVKLGMFIAHGGSTTSQAFSLFQARADFQSGHMLSLHDILLQHRSFLATDPRDKVFSLLSLADQRDVKAMGVQPDYRQSTHELFKSISIALLKRPKLDAFSASSIRSQSIGRYLPSWATDWSASDPSVPLQSSVEVLHGDESSCTINVAPSFTASKNTTHSPTFDHAHDLLGLDGILIDQVDVVGTLSRTRYLRHVSHMFELFVQCHDILEQLKDWETVARVGSKDRYPTGEKHREAYWHTLCAARVPPNLVLARHDPRYKYYILIRSLRRFVRLTIRWFPRSSKDTWYNRFFYSLFQGAWNVFGLTPAKIQRIGFPPESRLSNNRRMVRTKKGYLALAPRQTKEGDWILICKGGNLPLVVRQEGEFWVLVGESYVHGIMKGEAWDETKCERTWLK